MRILYLNRFLPRFDFWTGERGRQLVQALENAGAKMHTIPPIPADRPASSERSASSATRIKNLAKQRLPVGWTLVLVEKYLILRGFASTVASTWQLLRLRRQIRCEVMLARAFEYDWTPWIAARILKCPLVLETHSVFHLERQHRGRAASKFARWFERVQWRQADRIWVNSKQLKDILKEDCIPEHQIHFIPFGVDLINASKRSPLLAGQPVKIIFIGSFYTWHGVDVLLDAFAKAHKHGARLHLCLVGDGVVRADSERKAKELGIGELVHFTGWLPHEDTVELLKKSHIGVAPYLLLENFYFEPVKILEYMAAGLAIIASKQGRVSELVDDERTGLLVSPGDISALADALIRLSDDPALRERLGEQARTALESNQTWEITVQRVLALCEEAQKSWHNS